MLVFRTDAGIQGLEPVRCCLPGLLSGKQSSQAVGRHSSVGCPCGQWQLSPACHSTGPSDTFLSPFPPSDLVRPHCTARGAAGVLKVSGEAHLCLGLCSAGYLQGCTRQ